MMNEGKIVSTCSMWLFLLSIGIFIFVTHVGNKNPKKTVPIIHGSLVLLGTKSCLLLATGVHYLRGMPQQVQAHDWLIASGDNTCFDTTKNHKHWHVRRQQMPDLVVKRERNGDSLVCSPSKRSRYK
jgi:hypothetical protein